MARAQTSLAVVGADHPNKRGPGRRFEIKVCTPGEAVTLKREPKNPADPRAVAVYSARDVQIGYLTAERAPWISGLIDKGRAIAAVFQRPDKWGAVIRVAFDGEQPSIENLIEDERAASGEVEWYPDEVPPDE